MKKRNLKIVAMVAAPLLLGVWWMKRAGMLEATNVAQTSRDADDAALRTRRYNTDLQQAGALVQSTLAGLQTYGRPWKTIQIRRDEESIVFVVEVPVLMFVDDLEVTLTRDGNKVLCDVRSASRVGRGDFGENRRHILQLLHALDQRFDQSKGAA